MSETLVFVYGTLKRGGSNHRCLAGQRFVGEARTVPGYRLFVVADYPGLVRDPGDTRGVAGEIWAVDLSTLGVLDALEGIDQNLYRRAPVALQPPFDQLNVQAYYYLRDVRGHRPVPDGNWPVRPADAD